ncbi:MAG TPA: NAD(+) diphosphatase [Syntrophorhabdaceae bacterium]|jgi:NAD+ diphosphatase
MDGRFLPSAQGTHDATEAGWRFIFRDRKMLLIINGEALAVPLVKDSRDLGVDPVSERFIGILDGVPCYGVEAGGGEAPAGGSWHGLRSLYGRIDGLTHKIAMRAIHLLEWEKNEHYCGRCGSETVNKAEVIAKECPRCGHTVFPRISPAVIVLVQKEGKVLLARATRFAERMYSVLAGFVEPGESLEETVMREIEEEVGIKVKNIRYFGSQPWPFPDSLMIAFTADYESGEIAIDGVEIEEAAWFDPDQLPRIPGRISVARKLIDWFVEARMKKPAAGAVVEKSYGPDE